MKNLSRLQSKARFVVLVPVLAMLTACGAGASLDANAPEEMSAASHDASWTPDSAAMSATDSTPAADATEQTASTEASILIPAQAPALDASTGSSSSTAAADTGAGTATGGAVSHPVSIFVSNESSAQIAAASASLATAAFAGADPAKKAEQKNKPTKTATHAASNSGHMRNPVVATAQ